MVSDLCGREQATGQGSCRFMTQSRRAARRCTTLAYHSCTMHSIAGPMLLFRAHIQIRYFLTTGKLFLAPLSLAHCHRLRLGSVFHRQSVDDSRFKMHASAMTGELYLYLRKFEPLKTSMSASNCFALPCKLVFVFNLHIIQVAL